MCSTVNTMICASRRITIKNGQNRYIICCIPFGEQKVQNFFFSAKLVDSREFLMKISLLRISLESKFWAQKNFNKKFNKIIFQELFRKNSKVISK